MVLTSPDRTPFPDSHRGLQGALSPSRLAAIATVAELSSVKNISGQLCVAIAMARRQAAGR